MCNSWVRSRVQRLPSMPQTPVNVPWVLARMPLNLHHPRPMILSTLSPVATPSFLVVLFKRASLREDSVCGNQGLVRFLLRSHLPNPVSRQSLRYLKHFTEHFHRDVSRGNRVL